MTYDTIVLSGNSTNAVVTMGAIQMLHDNGKLKNISNYVGTSSGSILGCLMSVGYTPIDLLCHLCSNKTYSKIKGLDVTNILSFSESGLMSFEPISNELSTLFTDKIGFIPTLKQIQDLFNKTVVLVTYNLTKQRREYIRATTHPDLSVITAIRMSSNFPFVFKHFCYDGNYYVDGGLVDNFAVEYAELLGNHCVGVCTINKPSAFNPNDSYIEYIRKLFFTFIRSRIQDKIDRTNLTDIITINQPCAFFNFTHSSLTLIDLFDRGYDQARQNNLFMVDTLK
jgi:predicted acylesterase/phospholipase RssA